MAPVASIPREDGIAASPASVTGDEESTQDTSEKIKGEEMQVRRVQEWWADGRGPAAVAQSPVMAVIDVAVLAEVIHAGGAYHTILSADRLDGLHRKVGESSEPALEPLRKALQTRGGTKSQARVVGMLLFREARALFERCEADPGTFAAPVPAEGAGAPTATGAAASSGNPQPSPREAAAAVRLDEAWSPARRYICGPSYPEGAQMAVRGSPGRQGELLLNAPPGAEYMATGRVGEYLQICLRNGSGGSRHAYVLHTMGSLVLLVPAAAEATTEGTSGSGGTAAAAAGLDEVWSPPRRFVCSSSYPAGAELAARAAPGRDGTQLRTVPAGTEYIATGRCGDYLQVHLDIDGVPTAAYVPRTLGGTVLLVPAAVSDDEARPPASTPPVPSPGPVAAAAAAAAAAEAATAAAAEEAATSGRVAALEAKVAAQELQMQGLRDELANLRTQLGLVACAFRPFAAGGA